MATVNLEIKAKDNGASGKIKGITGSIMQAVSVAQLFQLGMRAAQEAIKLAGQYSEDFKKEQKELSIYADAISRTLGDSLGSAIATVVKNINDFVASKDGMQDVSKLIVGISAGFKIVSSAVGGALTSINDLITMITSAANTAQEFFKFLTGGGDWNKVQAAAKKTGDSFLKGIEDIKKGILDTSGTVVDEVINFNKRQEEAEKKLQKNLKASKDDAAKKELADKKKLEDEKKKLADEELRKQQEASKAAYDAWAAGTAAAQKIIDAQNKEIEDTISLVSSSMAHLSSVLGGVNDLVSQSYNDRLGEIKAALDGETKAIDEQTQKQLAIYGLQDKTRQGQIQKEITDLQDKLAQTEDEEEASQLRQEIATKQSELQKQKIIDEGEQRKTEAKKKSAAEQAKVEKAQFEATKLMKISQAWVDAASAVIGTWAGYASLGPFGAIAAGIQTTAIGVLAGVQTATIASQKYTPPAFMMGGEAPGGPVVVGEGGREMLIPPAGSKIINNSGTENLLNRAKTLINNIYLDGVLIKRQVINNFEYERYAY